ncbi:MAG: alpha/beta fold hydrolase [Ignavibacteria bacterium]|nr:alpha/beta fold hydrolase [Ignavibacteria bacterium]
MDRRNLLKGFGLFGLSTVLPFAGGGGILDSLNNPTDKPVKQENETPGLVFFNKLDNEFEFLNTLGYAHYRFADIGELLAIRALINEDDAETGVQAYLKFAQTCEATADTCITKGHIQSARDGYFRACTYYFSATSFLDSTPDPGRFTDIWKKHRECWTKGAKLMDLDYEEFEIPYEGKTLPGFFFKRKGDITPRPLFIMNNGSDGPIIASWTWGGSAALERGYNVLTFDGPGQGASLFLNKIYFRYDWEKVITPVIDSVINRKDVDKDKIVLYGLSQGGYWAPRAAAFESRIKVMIADPGVVDVSTSWLDHLPKELVGLLRSGNKEEFNKYMSAGNASPEQQAALSFRSRPYGIDDQFELFTSAMKYNITPVADKIKCHTIITDPENEQFWPGQAQNLYDMINAPKDIIRFTAAEGANYHCEPKAKLLWEQRVFDRLDEIIKKL